MHDVAHHNLAAAGAPSDDPGVWAVLRRLQIHVSKALVLSRSASQVLSIARNSSLTEVGSLPPSFASLAIWLTLRPIEASSPILLFSARSSSLGKGDADTPKSTYIGLRHTESL